MIIYTLHIIYIYINMHYIYYVYYIYYKYEWKMISRNNKKKIIFKHNKYTNHKRYKFDNVI